MYAVNTYIAYYHEVLAHNNQLYVFGGINKIRLNSFRDLTDIEVSTLCLSE